MNASFLSTWTSFKNLVWKEKRESFGPLVFGLAIFAIVPAGLELLDGCLSSSRTVSPWISSATFLAGWLFALGMGALTVCRDFGKGEERFLIAQPVSQNLIFLAKFFFGILVVLAILLASFLLEKIFHPWEGLEGFPIDRLDVYGFMLACFALAFAASTLTRQILSGILVAGLLILIWAVAPLLSTQLAFLHPFHGKVSFSQIWGAAVAASLLAAFLFGRLENPVPLGHRTLAWLTACANYQIMSD